MKMPNALRHKLNSRKSKKAPEVAGVPAVIEVVSYDPAKYAGRSVKTRLTIHNEIAKAGWKASGSKLVRVPSEPNTDADRNRLKNEISDSEQSKEDNWGLEIADLRGEAERLAEHMDTVLSPVRQMHGIRY
ncbi:hypothetical protein AX768_07005 [Burkholderia sp. PAMC 28687]|nr:hypothetical protein AX768_07005 [Burkholderia sp. PAMC 28687]